MAWIKTIPPEDAQGVLKQQYDAAIKRAGRIFNIVRIQSLNPRVLEASIGLYKAIMFGPSSLTRAQREMIAVVVSKTNDCFY
ncbi:MAG: peroxidase [Acidobacteria bacterium]|nr:MAG: peroxidase [Acidobacteriota bacterium]